MIVNLPFDRLFMAGVRSIAGLSLGAGVTHVSVTSPADVIRSQPCEGMNVFWYGECPIGHVKVHDGETTASTIGHIDAGFLSAIDAQLQRRRQPGLSASVVICTRDRAEQLKACLSSLPKQSYVPHEVIVVDNASRDRRTREVALAAEVKYVREERPGLGIARNAGISNATGDIIAFTDDDVVLHPNWLERLVSAFDVPQVAAVTGLVLPAELMTESQWHFENHWGFGRGYCQQDFDTARFTAYEGKVFPAWDVGAGANMALRRKALHEVGAFDERLGAGQAGCSEDSEYWYRLLAGGHTCRYVPNAVAFHFHRKTNEQLADQIYQYMRGHAAALLVQYERTGIAANRLQAYRYMPRWYLGRLMGCLFSGNRSRDRFLRQEVTGYLAGLLFYNFRRGDR